MSQLLLLCMDVHECKYTCTNIKCIIILNIFILNIQKLIGILNWKRMWRKKRCQIVSMNAPYVYTFLFLKEIDMQNRIKTIIRVPFKYNLVFLNGVIVYFHPWLRHITPSYHTRYMKNISVILMAHVLRILINWNSILTTKNTIWLINLYKCNNVNNQLNIFD